MTQQTMTQPPIPFGRAKLPVPPRDRRPALAALALLLVVVGALCSALIVYRSGSRVDVLTVSSTIAPGHRMTASDFSVTRIAGDQAGVVNAASRSRFEGTYATTKIPAGALINPKMFRGGDVIPPDGQVVGLQLGATQHPTAPIAAGDIVQLYLAPTGGNTNSSAGNSSTSNSSASNTAPAPGSVLVAAVRVTNIQQAGSSGNSSSIGISVLLSSADAVNIVPLAAESSVGVTLLSPGTKPGIDYLDS